MFPFIEFWFWRVYTFGLTLMICFFFFILILKKICSRFGINISFFSNRVLWFFLSSLIFSRLFYVISFWGDYKHIESPASFFLMSDYNFSLMGAIFWYLLVLFISTKINRIKSWKYLDASVLSFLFVAVIWYIWAFLGWQVYWQETFYWIEIVYNHPFSPVPYETWLFPLPIVYSIVLFWLFSFLYIIAMFVKIRWIIWYIWLACFGWIVLILEQFSWKYDYFYQNYWTWLNTIFSLILITYSFIWLLKIIIWSNKERDLTL